MVIITFVREAD